MTKFFCDHPKTTLLLLCLGILTTLLLDLSPYGSAGGITEVLIYLSALVFRVFTYTAVFLTCALLAKTLVSWQRAMFLGAAWSAIALGVAGFVWWYMANGGDVFNTPAIKRFVPGQVASFDPNWTVAEITLGREGAQAYTWSRAIITEFLALVLLSFLVAGFLRRCQKRARLKSAIWAPSVAMAAMTLYAATVAPWSIRADFDFFIGDALIGAMLFNGYGSVITLLSGGLTAPAVWVGLIAMVNVICIATWTHEQQGSP